MKNTARTRNTDRKPGMLKVTRETLRRLSTTELAAIAGGNNTYGGSCQGTCGVCGRKTEE